jgi:subtilase family serine protease
MTNASLRFLLFAVCMAIVTSLATVAPGHAESVDARHNVPLWISNAQLLGAAEEQVRVEIAVFLSFKDESGLRNFIAEQSNPRSVSYGNYLTPEQFHQRFSPDAKNVAKVQSMLKGFGFTIESTPDSGLFVLASGTVNQIKAAFGVSQNLYAYKGQVLRANTETPRLSPEMASIITFIAGLDDTKMLRKPDHIRLGNDSPRAAALAAVDKVSPNAPPPPQDGIPDAFCSTYWGDKSAVLSTTPKPYPKVVPYDICGYTPQQLRAAYGIDLVTETGLGVKVGIVDVYGSPTIERDTNRYSSHHGLPQINHTNFLQILPKGITNVPASDPCGPQGWYGEETLDVQAVHSMAPHAFIVYAGDTCTDPVNSPLYDLIDHHRVDIVTNSYSYGGEALPADFLNSENQFFMQAAAEGMSVLFSSGDDGDLAAINGIASGTWDATSPYVTAVGGTSLALFDAVGDKQEWAWGNYRAFLNDAVVSEDGSKIKTTGFASALSFYAGSGGGPSLSMLAPDYQANVSYTLSGYTTLADGELVPLESPHRVTPDISMVGDPYTGFVYGESYTITGDPVLDAGCIPTSSTVEYCEEDIGGTSLSSPLFAGVLALVNQSRFSHHKAAVGFVNPALYGMPVGLPGDTNSPIVDVQAPENPTAVLRTYLGSPTEARIVTINSGPSTTDPAKIIEGLDTSYLATPGYDNATGLGTPYVPALIKTFGLYSH